MRNNWWAKTLRVVGIVFMSLTAAFTLLGGLSTAFYTLPLCRAARRSPKLQSKRKRTLQ